MRKGGAGVHPELGFPAVRILSNRSWFPLQDLDTFGQPHLDRDDVDRRGEPNHGGGRTRGVIILLSLIPQTFPPVELETTVII